MQFRIKYAMQKEKDGFTLVEILVTLTILAAALPALLQAFTAATRNQALSDNSTTALYLLKFRMAEIEMEATQMSDRSQANSVKTRAISGVLLLKILNLKKLKISDGLR